jgi:hypothetical protein
MKLKSPRLLRKRPAETLTVTAAVIIVLTDVADGDGLDLANVRLLAVAAIPALVSYFVDRVWPWLMGYLPWERG